MLLDKKKYIAVIRFTEDLDVENVLDLRAQINRSTDETTRSYLIDLSGVEFLDSHGVGFFVSLLKKIHGRKGLLIFSGARDQPASVLNMVGFNSTLVTYCDSLLQARTLLEKEKG